jgi:HAD superfamily hydrolase (TIGR01509 family)
VIFDVDGTLVDTVDFHAEAWQRALSQFGFEVPYESVRSQIGKGGDQFLPVFLSEDEIDAFGDQIQQLRAQLFRNEYMPRIRSFPCVRELFIALRDAGWRTSLASSAKGIELEGYKQAANIADLVDTETSSDDAEHSKPFPDIFLAALDKLKLSAGDAIVVGDTPFDAQAAKGAGIRMIGVRCGGFTDESLLKAGAAELFDDCAHLLRALDTSSICAPPSAS